MIHFNPSIEPGVQRIDLLAARVLGGSAARGCIARGRAFGRFPQSTGDQTSPESIILLVQFQQDWPQVIGSDSPIWRAIRRRPPARFE
jgi:hypothetical protein